MTNPDGYAGETPPPEPSAVPSEPSSSGYEPPPIEQSKDLPRAAEAQPSYEAPPIDYPSSYPSYPAPPYPTPPEQPAGYGAPYPPPQPYGAVPGYPPPSYPPPAPYGAPGFAGANGYPIAGYGGYGGPAPGTNNSLAIGSLVASVLAVPLMFFCFSGFAASIAGVVMGIIALNQIKQSGQGGRSLAIAGIAVGIVVPLLAIVVFVIIVAASPSSTY
ncbi:DUF4190 domain-containing protein [Mycobacterium sp. 141]|uniref:DUF4190 domain-containing protein n=1 Tax=Mycobacterium sp. 141 TaxID=1120797 RepID=UPI00037CA854|nr:DUF4190 domain-containing protein [Mycobacterium sp. 141]